jgi:O-acetyl-ADP-ribose deacetylase (regulator of RNase III)
VIEYLDEHGWRPHVIFDDESDFYRWQPCVFANHKKGLTLENITAAHVLIIQQALDGVPRAGMRYRKGDCLDAQEIIVAHGCNAMGAMGSGFAKAVITRYPNNLVTYKEHHRTQGLRLGGVVWHDDYDQKLNMARLIANAITQPTYGTPGVQHVDYDAVRTSLTAVGKVAIDNGWDSVALPRIGADLGGGDWDTLTDIIEEVGLDLGIMFVVYILDSGQYTDSTHDYIKKCRTKRDQLGGASFY